MPGKPKTPILKSVTRFGYSPPNKKSFSRKLQHHWHGPFRIIKKLSPVHYHLRAFNTNCEVTTTVHANRLKPVTDPDERPILPPPEDHPSDPYLSLDDMPPDSFSSTHPNTIPNQDNDLAPLPTSTRNNVLNEPNVFSAERIAPQTSQEWQTRILSKMGWIS